MRRTVTITVNQKVTPDASVKKTAYMLSDESSLPIAPGCRAAPRYVTERDWAASAIRIVGGRPSGSRSTPTGESRLRERVCAGVRVRGRTPP
jgi:hypothetical protein